MSRNRARSHIAHRVESSLRSATQATGRRWPSSPHHAGYRELADRAKAILPDVKMIYTTGYIRNAVVHNSQLDTGTEFLAKPFGIDQLAAKVRAVLDQT